jgi:protein phosphatase
MYRWTSSAASDRGNVREVNEDAFLDRPDLGLWAVADGMGGHAAGDVASRLVVEALGSLPAPRFLGRSVCQLRQRLSQANLELREQAARRNGQIVGCTLAALLALGGHGVVVWAGDSRVYLLRRGVLRQLTRDHSQVEALIAGGLLDREAADHHPASNIITRAVGGDDVLTLDAQIQELRDQDLYLICSDGLTKDVSADEIAAELTKADDGNAAAALVERAVRQGARDNVTAVVVRIQPADTGTSAR